jgi:uncharacterized protein YkwD
MVDYHDLHSNGPCSCPKCKGGSTSSGPYTNSRESGSGKKVLAVVLIAVVALGAGGFFIFPRLGLFSSSPQTPSSPVNSPASMQTPAAQNDVPRPVAEQPKVTQPISTEQAPTVATVNTINQQILTKQLTMFSKDIVDLSATVPAKNNGILEAKILPEKSGAVEVKFYKGGRIYCATDAQSSCTFNVQGSSLASQKVDIPVKTGDVVEAIITNKGSGGFSQQVTVVFTVSYDEVVPTTNPAVPDKTATPTQPSSSKQSYDATGKPIIDTVAMEKQIHQLINDYRTSHGLTTLAFDEKLADIARAHSQDMATNNYFEHDNLQGQDPSQRAVAADYTCHKNLPGGYYTDGIGENIWQGWLYSSTTYYGSIPSHNWMTQEEIAKQAAQGWFDSQGHRENILTTTYDRQGLGIAVSSDDKVFATEDFC